MLNNYKRTKTLGVRFLSYYMLTKNESRLFFSFISIVLLRLFAVFFFIFFYDSFHRHLTLLNMSEVFNTKVIQIVEVEAVPS